MTNDLAALSEAYTKSPNALSLTLLGHALVDEYRAGRLVPVEQRDKAEALLCQRTNEYIEATARAEAAEARIPALEAFRDHMTAENARLRRYLREIENEPRRSRHDAAQVLADVQDIASKALGGEE